jgi:hypothetical protein
MEGPAQSLSQVWRSNVADVVALHHCRAIAPFTIAKVDLTYTSTSVAA